MFLVRWLCRLHDALTDAGYLVGTIGLFTLVTIYCYEVVTRYFFAFATDWANDTFSNVLCVTIFAMVPHVTRAGMHIAITLLPEGVPVLERPLNFLIGLIGFLVCLLVAVMSFEENVRQVVMEIVTEQNRPIPKIYISGFITYGFLGASLYFLRSLIPSRAVQPVTWVVPSAQSQARSG